MQRRILLGAVVTAALGVTSLVAAQDANEILKQVGHTYRNMESFHFEGTTVGETKLGNTGTRSEMQFSLAWLSPNKVRVEYRYPQAGTWLRVSDGKTMTKIRSITKEFSQQPASQDDVAILNGTPTSIYESADTTFHDPKVVRTEAIQLGGKNVDCYVIEVQGQPSTLQPGMEQMPVTLWVAKDSYLVLKEVSGTRSKSRSNATENTRTTTFTLADFNTKLPDDLFSAPSAPQKK